MGTQFSKPVSQRRFGRLRKNADQRLAALKGHGFQPPHIVFNGLRHGWKAMLFQNSDAQSFQPPPGSPVLGAKSSYFFSFAGS